MKIPLPLVSLLPAALLLAACTSPTESRIQEKAAVFGSLSPADQTDLRRGNVAVGYTMDMVYIARGKPSSVSTAAGPDDVGLLDVWTYRNYYPPEQPPGSGREGRPVAGGPVPSSALAAWGNSSLPSGASAAGDTVDTPGQGPSSHDVAAAPTLPTLFVYFKDGKVLGLKVE